MSGCIIHGSHNLSLDDKLKLSTQGEFDKEIIYQGLGKPVQVNVASWG